MHFAFSWSQYGVLSVLLAAGLWRKSQNLCGFALSETEGEENLISPS